MYVTRGPGSTEWTAYREATSIARTVLFQWGVGRGHRREPWASSQARKPGRDKRLLPISPLFLILTVNEQG